MWKNSKFSPLVFGLGDWVHITQVILEIDHIARTPGDKVINSWYEHERQEAIFGGSWITDIAYIGEDVPDDLAEAGVVSARIE